MPINKVVGILLKNQKNMSRKILIALGALLVISLSLFVFNLIYQNELPKIVENINNSAIGAIFTAIITVFLLQGQTATEEERDKNLSVFEKKQEVFHNFLEKLKEIVQDGKITISMRDNAQEGENIDELKELLFQLSYIQMHTHEDNTDKIFKHIANIIQQMNDFEAAGSDKQKLMAEFYANFSKELFGIITVLKSDLYKVNSKPIPAENIKSILEKCNLFVEGGEMDKYEMQNYFWRELQEELLAKGYQFKKIDFEQDVNKYYKGGRSRHKWFGFTIPIYTTQNNEVVNFDIELENDYYYGFHKDRNPKSELLQKCIKEAYGGFKECNKWYVWTYSTRYNLDFWNLNSPSFESLKHPQRRKLLIENIAREMDTYIQNFIRVAKENNL